MLIVSPAKRTKLVRYLLYYVSVFPIAHSMHPLCIGKGVIDIKSFKAHLD